MSFYNVRTPTYSNDPWAQQVAGMPNVIKTLYGYTDQALGYDAYIKSLNPSLLGEKTLRTMYPSVSNDYYQWVSNDYLNRVDTPWVDWLANEFDPNQELARMSPNARFEEPHRYQGKVRWSSF